LSKINPYPNVAIIDSGIDTYDQFLMRHVIGWTNVFDTSCRQEKIQLYDYIGHGTACAQLILKEEPCARLMIAKIFDKYLSADFSFVYRAISWAVSNDADVINLSFGSYSGDFEQRIKKMIVKASRRKIIIVAADGYVGDAISFPANLPYVIGVGATQKNDTDKIWFDKSGKLSFIGPFKEIKFDWSGGYRILRGSSFFAPVVTGRIAHLVRNNGRQTREMAIDYLRKKYTIDMPSCAELKYQAKA